MNDKTDLHISEKKWLRKEKRLKLKLFLIGL